MKKLFIFLFISVAFNVLAQTYSTPGSTSVTLQPGTYVIECWGADGGSATGVTNSAGGTGGYSKGAINVTTAATYHIYVGGVGGSKAAGSGTAHGAGGWNGGGHGGIAGSGYNGGGGGGGGSDVRTGGTAYANRIIVAGGGGGGGYYASRFGGNGGGITGGAAATGGNEGKSGTQTAGGAAGTGRSGTAGGLGYGGTGHGHSGTNSGGPGGDGGGGGYYGGGGGSNGASTTSTGGGGSGSGYIGSVIIGGFTVQPTEAGYATKPPAAGSNGCVRITAFACNSITIPPPTVTTPVQACPNTPIAINATPSAGASINWYAGSSGGSVIGSGNTYTPTPSGNISYWAGSVTASTGYSYTGEMQYVTLQPGTYTLECWGADGGNNNAAPNYNLSGGKGGYSRGVLNVTTATTYYIYIGGRGVSKTSGSDYTSAAGGWNGGGNSGRTSTSGIQYGGSGGGGGTDIRTTENTTYSNRIIVRRCRL